MKSFNLFGTDTQLGAIARRYFWTVPVVAILAMSISVLEGCGVSLLIPLLSSFSDNFMAGTGHGVLGFVERLAQGHSRNGRLLTITCFIFGFVLLKGVFQILANVFAAWVDGRIGHDIRCSLSRGLHGLGYPFFLVNDPSRLINILGTESWRASDAVRILLTYVASNGAVLVFAVMLALVSWRLSLIVIVGGLLTRTIQKRTQPKLRKMSNNTVAANELLASDMLFTVFGARLIRLFASESLEYERFHQHSEQVRQSIRNTEAVSGIQGPMLEAMHGGFLLLVLWVAVFTKTSLPVLITFLVLMNRLQPHLRILEQSGTAFASAAGHFAEVEWLLTASSEPQSSREGIPFHTLREGIRFCNVTYEYPNRAYSALAGVTFEIRKGRSTALIGSSGSGKSTILNLLCGLLEPLEGSIEVDGIALSRIDRNDWLNCIAIAGQDVDLIDGTILDNIGYARPEMDRAMIERAVRWAKADFVYDLPEGLNTLVGPRGLSLSGGQRQRISLARALAREPQILVLDEATNAIDQATQASIIASLQNLPVALTVIVVSHSLAPVEVCQDAVVLNGGRVIDAGPLASILVQRSMQV